MTATRRPLLVATVGLPGSGKSTWARWYQKAMDPMPVAVVERDTYRDMFGYRWDAPHGQRNDWEQVITRVQHAEITFLLRAGVDVVVADTNLVAEHLEALRRLAEVAGAKFETRDFTGVPLEECIARDAQRPPYEPGGPCSGRSVGADVIRGMWEKYAATHPGASGSPDGAKVR